MNWITVVWTMCASACLTIALIHLVIWLNDRKRHTHLLFAVAALSVAAIAAGELQMMLARTPVQFAWWLRWIHVPVFVAVVSIVWFVRFYFEAGRLWLAWAACATRLLALILNFAIAPNLNYREITSLRQIELFGGVTVAIAQGVFSQRALVGQLSSLLLLVFLVDASITVWRRGNRAGRRRVLVVGGSIGIFVVAAAGHVALIQSGLLSAPYMVSLAFLVPVTAMAYELGLDVVRSAAIARELDMSETESRENEQRMEWAATAAQLGMWRWDVVRDEIYISKTGNTLLGIAGFEPIDLEGFLQIVHVDDRQKVVHSVANAMNGNGDYECEYRIHLPDGRLRWVAAHGRVEFDAQSKPTLVRGGVLDITGRKQAEERFRLVADAAPAAMIVVSADGALTMVNAQTETVFGYTRQELIGQPAETLIPDWSRSVHQGDGHDYLSASQTRAMGAGRELLGKRKDGSEVPVEVALNPLQTPEGTLILASIIDMTERRKAERDQARQRNELAHLSRVAMLGELSGSLAHELNQPLTAILSNAQAAQEFLAQDSTDLDEVRGILQDIVTEDRRAREVIRRLRLLFRKGEGQFETLNLNELVVEVLKLMHTDLINHGVTVQTELSPGLPSVNGDRVQLQQVLINLIVNASDAMADSDYATRTLGVTTRLDENGDVRMSVTDTGCGIPDEEIERIFEPFHTTKAHGMGLGLAVCRTIISAHAGNLWATNHRERGGCFHVTLSPMPGAT